MARLRPQDAARHQAAGPDFLEALARGLAVLQAFGPEVLEGESAVSDALLPDHIGGNFKRGI